MSRMQWPTGFLGGARGIRLPALRHDPQIEQSRSALQGLPCCCLCLVAVFVEALFLLLLFYLFDGSFRTTAVWGSAGGFFGYWAGWITGKNKLDAATKSEVARWVLFLKTDLRYEWPVCSTPQMLGMLMANLITLGMANRIFIPRFAAHGDVAVWPFIRTADFEAALHNPPYLRDSITAQPSTEK